VTGNLDLRHRVAAVSGGLGDIGRAVASALASAGAQVALGDRLPMITARRVMPGFHYTRVDVTRKEQIDRWLRQVASDLGTPDLVICNAGIVKVGTALETTRQTWDQTMAVNLAGAFFLAQSAAQRLLRRRKKGRIIFVGSWAAHAPHRHIAAYSVAKAGLRMAMKCLALELAGRGILVNEIAPGKADAGLSRQLFAQRKGLRDRVQRGVPVGELLQVDEIARGVLFLCDPQNCHMTGSVLLIDGGVSLVYGP